MSVAPGVLPPLRLGACCVDPPLLLAPMAGFTDAPMRWIAHRHGAAFAYTEMANARAIADGAGMAWRILETLEGEGPLAAHLYGAEPDEFARAAERICQTGRFAAIDLNCGCPVPKVTQCGAGAALMRTPSLFGKIVAATVRHSTLPVTVKTRLGWHPGETVACELVRIAADNGATAIAIHGRYAIQHHAGAVAFEPIAQAVRLERLPVLGNGGIRTPAQALEMIHCTGVAGLLVGWGAVGDPWLFGDLRQALHTGTAAARSPVPVPEIRRVLHEHLRCLLAFKVRLLERWPDAPVRVSPEEGAVLDFRCQLFRYLKGLRGVSRLRGRLSALRTLPDVHDAIDEALAVEAGFRARVGRV